MAERLVAAVEAVADLRPRSRPPRGLLSGCTWGTPCPGDESRRGRRFHPGLWQGWRRAFRRLLQQAWPLARRFHKFAPISLVSWPHKESFLSRPYSPIRRSFEKSLVKPISYAISAQIHEIFGLERGRRRADVFTVANPRVPPFARRTALSGCPLHRLPSGGADGLEDKRCPPSTSSRRPAAKRGTCGGRRLGNSRSDGWGSGSRAAAVRLLAAATSFDGRRLRIAGLRLRASKRRECVPRRRRRLGHLAHARPDKGNAPDADAVARRP